MNVYDFDKTIYAGDATLDFWGFCLKRYPEVWLCLPGQLFAAAKYAFGLQGKTCFKEDFYRFLQFVPEVDGAVTAFWKKQEKKIYPWYLAQRKSDDVVISASPEFLLAPVCGALGTGTLVASRVDKKTGKYTGENCYGEEKPRRFQERFSAKDVDGFYTDSLSDLPMLCMARQGYLVKKGILSPFEKTNA